MVGTIISIVGIVAVILGVVGFIFMQYRSTVREAKNYERGLKMVPLLIHLPPSSDDLETGGRDERDVTEEVLSQAQVMYNIIASTATRGFKSNIYGQRHLSFEMVAQEGLVHYYAVVPVVLIDTVRQAIAAAYPSARLEEVEEHTVFSKVGKMSGTIGGEFTLKKSFVYPIATYQELKRDASRALLNALSTAGKEDGIGIQLMIRPASEGWTKKSVHAAEKIVKDKGVKKGFGGAKDIMQALWKPPEDHEETAKPEEKQLTNLEKAKVESIEEKTRYPGYETLMRVVVSSNTAAQSQVLLKNVVSAFSLFDSPTNNGFKFAVSRNIEELVTAYIFRFFPQSVKSNVLNTVELATLFHLPDQKSIPTSQVQRQMSKQVDGPTQVMDEGFLLGYNEFRGVKKPIRLSTNDRRRHTYIIGQTGTGKSVLLENLAYQDMMDGKGFAFVDPHGDSVEALIGKVPKERVEDIIYFNPGDMTNPIGLNMFEFDHEDQKDFLVQEAINMLYGLYDPGHTGIVGPRLEHIFRNAALLLMADPAGGTFIDIPKVLIDQDYMKSKLKYVKDQSVLDFWTKEWPNSQRSNEAGEVVSWVVSKFGPFISNDAMRNIIGQTKSGFNLREIMDGKKILLVNLSKGRMGELNSKLLGIIFVMKFQAAAMGRANIPESERVDFSLYVDEFQNFATDSFESILSEARKYRLNLIMGNQFMTQLTDKIREAIIGNVGTVISGRIGTTDAELMVKRFKPTFDEEDLAKLPNHQSITSVMINNVPSAPFSMSWIPPMGQTNPQLSDALKRLSAAKFGKPRSVVEKDIFDRLGAAEKEKKQRLEEMRKMQQDRMGAGAGASGAADSAAPKPAGGGSSFLDEWLSKRQQLGGNKPGGASLPPKPAAVVPPSPTSAPAQPQAATPSASAAVPDWLQKAPIGGNATPAPMTPPIASPTPAPQQPAAAQAAEQVAENLAAPMAQAVQPESIVADQPLQTSVTDIPAPTPAAELQSPPAQDLQLKGDKANEEDEVHLKLR